MKEVLEWGVRYPSGAVESFGANESEARRLALTTTSLRPDLPTLVVRRVVTPWEVPGDPQPGTLEYAEMVASRHGDLEDAALEDGMD